MKHLARASKHLDKQILSESCNAFIARQGAGGYDGTSTSSLLNGKLIAVKDNICTKDQPTTCASQFLQGFQSPFDATVVRKLKAAGATIVGKTNMDEFGMGSDSVYSHFGPVNNIWERDNGHLSAGGSSGGSAIAVLTSQCWGALGTDTGGSVRLPAAFTGVVGFKPSYGLLSRWGLVAYANSLDTVGILTKKVSAATQIFNLINGHDERDPTSLSTNTRSRMVQRVRKYTLDRSRVSGSMLRIGVPQEYNTSELEPTVRKAWIQTLQSLQAKGHSICPISLPATKKALSAYYVLAPAEASSNLAKYDGVRYGAKAKPRQRANDVLFSVTRGSMLGREVQRRILLGSYSLSAGAIDNYFIKAQEIRRLVQQDFDNVFALTHPLLDAPLDEPPRKDKIDYILTPTAQSLPPKLKDIEDRSPVEHYSADVLTVPASLAGLPAISVPVPIEADLQRDPADIQTVGIQLIGQYGDDNGLLSVAETIEKLSIEQGT